MTSSTEDTGRLTWRETHSRRWDPIVLVNIDLMNCLLSFSSVTLWISAYVSKLPVISRRGGSASTFERRKEFWSSSRGSF